MNAHFIWIGDHVPVWVRTHVEHWERALPDCDVKLWTGEELEQYLPPDPGKRFAKIIGKKHHLSINAWRANIARFRIVDEFGGWYFDTDSVPIQFPYNLPVPSSDDIDMICLKMKYNFDNCMFWGKAGRLSHAGLEEREMRRARHGLHFSDAMKEGLLKVDTIYAPRFFADFPAWPTQYDPQAIHFRAGSWWANTEENQILRELSGGSKSGLEFGIGGTTHELAETCEKFSVVDNASHYARYAREYIKDVDKSYFRRNLALSVTEMINVTNPDFIFVDPKQDLKPRVLRCVLKHAKKGTRVVAHDATNTHFKGHEDIMPLMNQHCGNIQLFKTKGGIVSGEVK